MDDNIIVRVDADLKEIVPGFIQNRRQDIVAMETFLYEKNYEAIRLLGHSMKGAGTSYGFHFISEIGKAIEAAAKAGSAQIIAQKKTELKDFLDGVQIEFVVE